MRELTMKVRGGESIDQACREAQRIADLAGAEVHFVFNDVLCIAEQGGEWAVLAERQQAEQKRKRVVRSSGQ